MKIPFGNAIIEPISGAYKWRFTKGRISWRNTSLLTMLLEDNHCMVQNAKYDTPSFGQTEVKIRQFIDLHFYGFRY